MTKEVMLVYQDCPMCGARSGWGEEQTKIADNHGFTIKKVPFYTKDSSKLMWRALECGIKSYPFFTDGKKFSKNLEDFIEKPKKKHRTRKKEGGESRRWV